jgi:hypothetical protein
MAKNYTILRFKRSTGLYAQAIPGLARYGATHYPGFRATIPCTAYFFQQLQ